MREIAVVVSNDNKNVDAIETIDAIKKAGFKNVFIQWYNKTLDPSQEIQLEYIRKQKLNVIFAHLGYKNINDLWIENKKGNTLVDKYKNDIKVCKQNNIPMVVMHLTNSNIKFKCNENGLKRLQEIVDYAEFSNMKIAFENTAAKGYLEYVIEHINNKNVGICFDSGHYHAHFNDEFDFLKFKNKILAIHLHDNDKSYDQHLMPFDGTLDWDNIVKNLKNANYDGPITLEICYRNTYLNNNIENFYKEGYNVANKLRTLFEN